MLFFLFDCPKYDLKNRKLNAVSFLNDRMWWQNALERAGVRRGPHGLLRGIQELRRIGQSAPHYLPEIFGVSEYANEVRHKSVRFTGGQALQERSGNSCDHELSEVNKIDMATSG